MKCNAASTASWLHLCTKDGQSAGPGHHKYATRKGFSGINTLHTALHHKMNAFHGTANQESRATAARSNAQRVNRPTCKVCSCREVATRTPVPFEQIADQYASKPSTTQGLGDRHEWQRASTCKVYMELLRGHRCLIDRYASKPSTMQGLRDRHERPSSKNADKAFNPARTERYMHEWPYAPTCKVYSCWTLLLRGQRCPSSKLPTRTQTSIQPRKD